ncbi:MAG: hypothetical protein ACI4WX_01580 [Aristaeellaceae bacterium]
MLLKKFWSLLTVRYGSKNRVGEFWKKYFPFSLSDIWGLPLENSAGAWQNHIIQPSRGFFTNRHTRNNDSMNELFEGFYRLTRQEGTKCNIYELALELFNSDEAHPVRAAHGDQVEALLSDIQSAADNAWETAIAITAVFWFCFSLRPRNKKTYDAWKKNAEHEIPEPENRYLQLISWLYTKRYANFYPEDQWVLNLSLGRPNMILPKMENTGIDITYHPETGFVNVPPAWEDLLTLQQEYPELFNKYYKAFGHLPYTSPIVGIMKSQYIPAEPRTVRCQYYKIDYRAHRIREAVVNEVRMMFPEWKERLSLDVNRAREEKYGWLRTSAGVNVIVDIPQEQALILHVRGKIAEYNNAGKIYPSIVETIDLVEEHQDFTLENVDPITACVTRGLKEELGLSDCIRKKGISAFYTLESIKHVAFARTLDFDQDNFFTIVHLNDDVSFDHVKAMAEHASEKGLEINNVFTISNQPEQIVQYMIEHADQMIHQTRYALWLYILDRLSCSDPVQKSRE